VKLIPNEPHPSWNDGFPLTRDLPPITLEVNGIKIFAKGSNWAAPDIFTGTISRETYEPLLKYAKEAHFNLLRMWGGSMISKESFFDLCDEMGIMVWQEFMLACNNYKDIPRYLEVLDRESQSIIKKVRRHACLAIWCGGNELFNNWSGMNDQSHALRLLNANCYHLDRLTPFLPTSPVYGMAHGHYLFRYGDGRDCLEAMINSCKSAYTEFGNPSLADIDSLKAIIPEEQLFPPTPGGAWEEHHAFGAWQKDSWLELPTIEHYFGKPESLEELIGYTQTLQCIGYKGIFEEARRQFPHCSMALNWCYNEPWINAANNNLLIYPAKPKPAYYAVQASCRPIMASARVKRFDYTCGDIFEAELFILNDLPEDLGQFTVTARIDEIIIGKWITGGVRGTSNIRSGIYYSHRLDFAENCMFRLSVEVLDHPEMDSEYLFLYKT
jgi:beta-mannosidase